MEVCIDSTGRTPSAPAASPPSTRPGSCSAGRAMVLSATLALGGCALGACTDDPDFEPKMPSLASAATEDEEEVEEVEELDLAADAARVEELEASPGFVPDPMIESGLTSGGSVDLDDFDERCAGWSARAPDFIVDADRPFAELSVMVASDADTTLLVVGPDGETRCGDDDDGTHPVVRGAFDAGRIRIWVGTRARGVEAAFVLGLSELDDSAPSSLVN